MPKRFSYDYHSRFALNSLPQRFRTCRTINPSSPSSSTGQVEEVVPYLPSFFTEQ